MLRGMWATGAWFLLASVGFWLSWWLMPGVGVTDTATIFVLVSQQRASVYASVVMQLISAAAYVVGAAQLRASDRARASRAMRVGGTLLAVGAVGSAADAMFHLIAYEMTAPGTDLPAMVPVMQRLQGPDLGLLAPFIAAFLAGHLLVALAWRDHDRLARGAWWLIASLPAIAVLGALARRADLVSGRVVGLAVLAVVSGSLALVAIAVARSAAAIRGDPPAPP
jgi:hypothetical protein